MHVRLTLTVRRSQQLKVTTKYWSEMQQATEIKKETRQINSSATVMLSGRRGELNGFKPFCGFENVQAAPQRRVLLDANAFFLYPSLSQNLAGKSAITEIRTRYRSASLSLSQSFLAEAYLARSASCVVSDVRTTAIDADGPRRRANKQQHRCLIAARPRDGVPSRLSTQPRAPRGLVSHTLKNVAARRLVACGPETNSCGAAASYLN